MRFQNFYGLKPIGYYSLLLILRLKLISLFILFGILNIGCNLNKTISLAEDSSTNDNPGATPGVTPDGNSKKLSVETQLDGLGNLVSSLNLLVGQSDLQLHAIYRDQDDIFLNGAAVSWTLVGSFATLSIQNLGMTASLSTFLAGSGKVIATLDDKTLEILVTVAAPAMPEANSDTRNTAMSSTDLIDVLGNDVSYEGALTLVSVSAASNGVSSISAGKVNYVPTLGFVGTETLSYTISDGIGSTDTGSLTIEVLNSKSWTGLNGDSDWTNLMNWCGAIVAGNCTGTTAPTTGDIAYFNTCTNCDPNIPDTTTLDGIRLLAGYTGTLTAAGGMTINGTFIQNAGNFNGGSSTTYANTGEVIVSPNAEITVENDIILETGSGAGTSFHGFRLLGTWTILGNMVVGGAPLPGGLFQFKGTGAQSIDCEFNATGVPGGLLIDKASGVFSSVNAFMNMTSLEINQGTFTPPATLNIIDEKILLGTYTSLKTGLAIDFSGSLLNFVVSAVSDGNSGTFILELPDNTNIGALTSQTTNPAAAGVTHSIEPFNGRSITVLGDLNVETARAGVANSGLRVNGLWNLEGDLIFGNNARDGGEFKFSGGNAQTITLNGFGAPSGDMVIDKLSGDVTANSNIDLTESTANFTVTNGIFNLNGMDLSLNLGSTITLDAGGIFNKQGGTHDPAYASGNFVDGGTYNP